MLNIYINGDSVFKLLYEIIKKFPFVIAFLITASLFFCFYYYAKMPIHIISFLMFFVVWIIVYIVVNSLFSCSARIIMDLKLKSLDKYEKFILEYFLQERKVRSKLCDYEKIRNLHDKKILTKDYKVVVYGALNGVQPSLTTLASKRYRKLDGKYRLSKQEIKNCNKEFEEKIQLLETHFDK